MLCDVSFDDEGLTCRRCGNGFPTFTPARLAALTYPISRIYRLCEFGPGSELTALIKKLGYVSKPNCACKRHARMMDELGVEGCRRDRAVVIQWINDARAEWGITGLFGMAAPAWHAFTSGLAFRLNPLDPVPSLVDEAIRRAEAKAAG